VYLSTGKTLIGKGEMMSSETTRRVFVRSGIAAFAIAADLKAGGPSKAGFQHPEAVRWEAGRNTHENIVFVCSGGMSNAGIMTMLAGLDVVKEQGLAKVAIGCLAGVPWKIPTIVGKARAARKLIVVDGCENGCARKIVETAGLRPVRHVVLTRDVPMKKKSLHEDIGGQLKGVMDYIDDSELRKAKDLIRKAIEGEG